MNTTMAKQKLGDTLGWASYPSVASMHLRINIFWSWPIRGTRSQIGWSHRAKNIHASLFIMNSHWLLNVNISNSLFNLELH